MLGGGELGRALEFHEKSWSHCDAMSREPSSPAAGLIVLLLSVLVGMSTCGGACLPSLPKALVAPVTCPSDTASVEVVVSKRNRTEGWYIRCQTQSGNTVLAPSLSSHLLFGFEWLLALGLVGAAVKVWFMWLESRDARRGAPPGAQ
jgi:hypothetical protein